jgi:hypothetical protein
MSLLADDEGALDKGGARVVDAVEDCLAAVVLEKLSPVARSSRVYL